MPGFNIIGAVDNDGKVSNTLETARRHRYALVALDPLKQSILIIAHKCGRPTPEIDRMVMHRGQDEIYLPGKQRWLPIEIAFYETITTSGLADTAQQVYAWWSQSVLNLANSCIQTDFKRDATLSLLDGINNPVWTYNLYNTWPSKITPDALDYSDNGICEIIVTLQMDKAAEAQANSGGFVSPLLGSCEFEGPTPDQKSQAETPQPLNLPTAIPLTTPPIPLPNAVPVTAAPQLFTTGPAQPVVAVPVQP